MSGASASNTIVLTAAITALALQIFVVFTLYRFRKAMASFPGSEFLKIVFYVMAGMTVAQTIDVSAAAYMAVAGQEIPDVETVQFVASHIVVVYSMVWGYVKVTKIS